MNSGISGGASWQWPGQTSRQNIRDMEIIRENNIRRTALFFSRF